LGGKLSPEDKETVDKAVQASIDRLEKNQQAETEDFKEQKKKLEEIVTPIMSKLYQGQPPPGGEGQQQPPPGGHDGSDL